MILRNERRKRCELNETGFPAPPSLTFLLPEKSILYFHKIYISKSAYRKPVNYLTSEEMLKVTASELEKLFTNKNVVGTPVDLGDKTVITLSRYGFGFGAGGTHMNQTGGEGGGAGGGIEPIALIVVHKDISGPEGIKVLSLRWNPFAQVVEVLSESLAPQVIEAIKVMTGHPTKEKGEG
jgi:uncharacterized spore protein YtfJ